jgi:glycosyltransferase involved in cell wall biosynthesis
MELTRHSKSLPILRIPVLVSGNEAIRQDSNEGSDYFVFCAHLDGYPQDALFVVKALGLVDSRTCKLVMVGGGSETTVRLIREEAERAGVAGRVVFQRDYLSDTDLASLYRNAAGLLAPVFCDERSLARFPSKIADYLLSGTPVISGAFGEVGEYLKDGESAFLTTNQSTSAFALKISEALSSRERATRVGAAGSRLALSEFCSLKHGIRLSRFLEEIGSKFWRSKR